MKIKYGRLKWILSEFQQSWKPRPYFHNKAIDGLLPEAKFGNILFGYSWIISAFIVKPVWNDIIDTIRYHFLSLDVSPVWFPVKSPLRHIGFSGHNWFNEIQKIIQKSYTYAWTPKLLQKKFRIIFNLGNNLNEKTHFWNNTLAIFGKSDVLKSWNWQTIPSSSRKPQTIFSIPTIKLWAHHFSSLNL